MIRLAEAAKTRIARQPRDPQISGKTARWIERQFLKLGWLRPGSDSTGASRLIKPVPGVEVDAASPPGSGKSESMGKRPTEARGKERGSSSPEATLESLERLRALAEGGPKRSLCSEILARLLRLECEESADPGLDSSAASSEDYSSGPGNSEPSKRSRPVPWGRLEIEEPPRISSFSGRLGRRWRAAQEGTRIRAPHRILTDDRVFGKKRWAQGGSVLIDASGSMSLSVKDLWAIVENAPGATVAVYAGQDSRGLLRILARNGRIVPREACHHDHLGSMNVVDGPALRWLARQSRPRLWISDGRVTGIADRTNEWNRARGRGNRQRGRDPADSDRPGGRGAASPGGAPGISVDRFG